MPGERAAGIAKLRLAALVLFTFPGSPMIYYGDEAGMEGFEDPLNRGTYPWGREDRDLLAWFTRLSALRNAYPALQSGTISWLYTAGPLLIFARQNGDQRLTTAVNASPDSHTVTLLWEGAGPTDLPHRRYSSLFRRCSALAAAALGLPSFCCDRLRMFHVKHPRLFFCRLFHVKHFLFLFSAFPLFSLQRPSTLAIINEHKHFYLIGYFQKVGAHVAKPLRL